MQNIQFFNLSQETKLIVFQTLILSLLLSSVIQCGICIKLSLVLVLVSFTVNAILRILTIFLFKILCWQCWIIMLEEWDEDNELAPLEPVVERACSIATSFVYSTFGSNFRNGALRKTKTFSCSKAMGWWANPNNQLLNSIGRKAGLREVSCVFLHLVLYLHCWGLKCCDHPFTKILIAAVVKDSLMLITSNLFFKQQLLLHLATFC